MKGLILCAGFGKRFLPYTNHLAKSAFPFLNTPLFCYPLYHLEKMGVKNFFINLHHLPETVKQASFKFCESRSIYYSHESQILNSGGGIGNLRDKLEKEELFFIANGDSVLLFPHKEGLNPLLKAHRKEKALATLLTTDHPFLREKFQGLVVDKDRRIIGFGGDPEDNELQHFTGYYILSPRIFEYIETEKRPHIFEHVLSKAISCGEKVIAHYDKNLTWFETGNKEDFLNSTKECVRLLKEGAPEGRQLEEILTCFLPTLKKEKNVWAEEGSLIKNQGSGFILAGKKASFEGRCDTFLILGEGQKFKGEPKNTVVIDQEKKLVLF